VGYSAAVVQYLALLRGINVGGNNIIKMTDLKACFEALGFGAVSTFIQSGNVLFEAPIKQQSAADLAAKLEGGLSERFGYQSRIVLRSHDQLRAIVADAPPGFGTEPDLYRYDVIFLREPVTAAEVMRAMPVRDGVDRAYAGNGVCYVSRLVARASQSYISKLVSLPSYQSMSIRNWNTTIKLHALMDARAGAGRAAGAP
jgi:uncharacterized protein (DUF1697 family)